MKKIVLILLIIVTNLMSSNTCSCDGSWVEDYISYNNGSVNFYFMSNNGDILIDYKNEERYTPDYLFQCSENAKKALDSVISIRNIPYNDNSYFIVGDTIRTIYKCEKCQTPSDPTPIPPQDTNTTQWELLAEKSCKDNTALPQECSPEFKSKVQFLNF